MEAAYTVLELTSAIRQALAAWLPNEIWVQGEIADMSRSNAGHVYFQLVEPAEPGRPPAAALPVTLLDPARRHVNATLHRAGGAMRMVDGTRVRIRGRIELYEPRGRLQLRMSGIDPSYTLGLLVSERDRVVRALTDEGVLERNRRLAFPVLPLHVGLVTSRGSAAMADFVDELARSTYSWRVTHVDTRVQGPGADHEVARAVRVLAARGVDVVALIRGGGARTDLAVFDSEVVARAIVEVEVPVLTGIGHEVDQTVADLVAHASHKTPTACAASLVAVLDGASLALSRAGERVVAAARTDLRHAVERLGRSRRSVAREARRQLVAADADLTAGRRRLVHETRAVLARAELMLSHDAGQLHASARQHARTEQRRVADAVRTLDERSRRALERAATEIDRDAARVSAADPARAFARGWSITRTQAGSVIRRIGDVEVGDDIVTVLADGELTSRVQGIDEERSDGE